MNPTARRIQELESQLHQADEDRRTFVAHLARLERRNVLLQERLDLSIGREARTQADQLDNAKVELPTREPRVSLVHSSLAIAPSHGGKAAVRAQRVEAMHQALRAAGEPMSVSDLSRAMGMPYGTLYAFLNIPREDYGVERLKFPNGLVYVQLATAQASA